LDVGGTQKAHHLLISHSTSKSLQAEDLNYLKEKGAFSLPSVHVCNALVESYFHHVHPTIPIIDEAVFLKAYRQGGIQQVNLLLLWSMFSASASYVEDWIVQDAGYTTRVQLKESYLKRAKPLFHLSGEDDKIVLIQSALLISFWFCDTSDIMQTWYWTGIAFGLAQTLGLHRNPDAEKLNISVSDRHRRLSRRIWWCCVIRDSWLALLMGRPMRINHEDCDCPVPTQLDFADSAEGSTTSKLWGLWLQLLDLSKVLREILILSYRQRSEPTATRITTLESLINHHAKVECSDDSPIVRFHCLQLQLYQQVALIALFHSYCRSQKTAVFDSIAPITAVSKVKDAAASTNTIIEGMIAIDGIRYFSPVTVSLLPPAMQVHLMESKSRKPLVSQLATTKLDICLMVLAELQNSYPSAAIFHELFSAAKVADVPISHLVSDMRCPAPSSHDVVTTSDTSSPSGLLWESPESLLWDDMFCMPDLPFFPSLSDVWQAEAESPLELNIIAPICSHELAVSFD
jgi:hypothetical protein